MSSFLFACASVKLFVKFAKKGLMNFLRSKFRRAALCDTLSFVLQSKRGFFISAGSTVLENFFNGCGPFTRTAATVEAVLSSRLTNPTNAKVG